MRSVEQLLDRAGASWVVLHGRKMVDGYRMSGHNNSAKGERLLCGATTISACERKPHTSVEEMISIAIIWN